MSANGDASGRPTLHPVNQAQTLINTAAVKCTGCGKNEKASDAFACKTCTASEKKVVLVCGACGLRAHKAHEIVDYDALANAADIVSVMQEKRQHNDTVQRDIDELRALFTDEMQRIFKDCQVDVGANRPLSLVTKEEHERRAKESGERRPRSARALDAAKQVVHRCCQELSNIRATDDEQPSADRRADASNATRNLKRASATGVDRRHRSLSAARKSRLDAVLAEINKVRRRKLYNLYSDDDSPRPAKFAKSTATRR